jgi:hypothetical protein
VPDGHKKYTGETRFPLLGQNLHRYAFYAAVVISLINTYDAIIAFHSPERELGIGRGETRLHEIRCRRVPGHVERLRLPLRDLGSDPAAGQIRVASGS